MIPGALRFVSFALHTLPCGRSRKARFSEGVPTVSMGTWISTARPINFGGPMRTKRKSPLLQASQTLLAEPIKYNNFAAQRQQPLGASHAAGYEFGASHFCVLRNPCFAVFASAPSTAPRAGLRDPCSGHSQSHARKAAQEIPRSARDFACGPSTSLRAQPRGRSASAHERACPEQLSKAKASNGPARRLKLLKWMAASTLIVFQKEVTRSALRHRAGRVHG